MPKIDYAELRSRLRIIDVLTQIGWQSTQAVESNSAALVHYRDAIRHA